MKKLLAAIIVSVMVVLCLPFTARAIEEPDTPPQINATYIFQFNDGSIGMLVEYYLDYSSLPAETATEAYLVVLYNLDTSTQIKAVAPYTFVDSGYGINLAWLYFTADEVTAHGLSYTGNYESWLVGNPMLSWNATVPKTIGVMDEWIAIAPNMGLGLKILYYAGVLEDAWSIDMVSATSLGNKLTTVGESYFENVIPNVRTLAPLAFSSLTTSPSYTKISYKTDFGATVTSGSGNITGSPVTLTPGVNTITVNSTGSMYFDLANYTYGTVTSGTGTVQGSPVDIYPGVNELVALSTGTLTVNVWVEDESSAKAVTITGTGFDLTDIATSFGMSRWMFSGIVWMIITIIICAALYKVGAAYGGAKVVMLVFSICLVGGTLLGMLHPLVSAVMLILYGGFIGYILFFRSESLHKGFMFMVWMFIIVTIAGNTAAIGQMSLVSTRLTITMSDSESKVIHVVSTEGFPKSGIIVIGNEKIGYPKKTDTEFIDVSWGFVTTREIVRGAEDTEPEEHAVGSIVRTKESSLLNAAIDYKIASLVDAAGQLDFITLPVAFFDLVGTFFTLPLDFLGTELAVLGYVWIVVVAGMIVGFVISIIGGRRV